MARLLFIVIIATIGMACNPVVYPMPGKNYDTISNIQVQKPFDSVWAASASFFTGKGYTFRQFDKANGIIVTDKYDFSRRFSFVKNGMPMDTSAWVALSYITNKGGFGTNPFTVVASWTVKIQPAAGGTAIRIDLGKVDASVTKRGKSSYHPDQLYTFQGQSTGVFEKMLAAVVNQ